MSPCVPVAPTAATDAGTTVGRGLHSSTSQLNLSHFTDATVVVHFSAQSETFSSMKLHKTAHEK